MKGAVRGWLVGLTVMFLLIWGILIKGIADASALPSQRFAAICLGIWAVSAMAGGLTFYYCQRKGRRQ
ncbi:MAG TPA: hypothetical protein VMX18_01725 [Candidatus Bipolaricaulota bacterium]|nr:hypothetical protein [Candidatus Bipolaricaulota bacterium]